MSKARSASSSKRDKQEAVKNPTSSKQRKLHHQSGDQVDDGSYHGSIVRVKLINFLTYDDVEFCPGPNLNVIVGPNGTGKSSIVCALCLGLGEKPTTLGRAKEVGEFVKHKKTKATIEIELKNTDGPNFVIKREIHKAENRSVWHFNGKSINYTEVKERMKGLNIQMGNLCQFLPQDRVVEFAKMSQQQLLEATEKAIGKPGMYENHQKISKHKEREKTVGASLKEKNDHKERLVQRNALLEREVQRFQERKKHLDLVELLEKKKPWAQYEEARIRFVATKERKDVLEKELKDAQKVSSPMQKKLDQVSKRLFAVKDSRRTLNEDGQNLSVKARRKCDQIEKQQEKIEEVTSELQSLKKQEENRQAKLKDLQTRINSLEQDFQNAPDPESLQPRFQEVSEEMRTINRRITTISQEAAALKEESDTLKASIAGLNSQLKEIDDVGNRRLQKLRQVDHEAYDAVHWLNNNKDKFRGHVYEPIMLQINLKNLNDAKFLEATIARRDLFAFVCESKEDQQLFLHEVREKQGIPVNVVYPATKQPLNSYNPSISSQNLKNFGFTKYLADLFDAPEVVMRYLYETCHLYNIPISNTESKDKINQAIDKSGFTLFFTPTQRYQIRRSLYGSRETSTMTSNLQPGKLLSVSADTERKHQLTAEKQEYEKNYRDIHDTHKKLVEEDASKKKELENLRQEKKELQKQMNRRKALQTQIETKKKTLENIQEEAPDIQKEEEKAKKEISKINKKRVQLAQEYKNDVEKILNLYKEMLSLALIEGQASSEKASIENKIRESKRALQHLENEYKRFHDEFLAQKESAKRLLTAARRKTDTPDKKELSDEYKERFKMLPNTVDDIDDMIHEEKAKADCNYETSPEVLKEYKKNNKEIDELSEEIESEEAEKTTIEEEIDIIKREWLKPLELLIAEINVQYCEFFKRMGCAGQVSLYKDPDDNYSKYGIEIKVTYRSNEKLKVLTAHHQSGGERSVATMLYLISLQELNRCPFRVVDEINQGMDPNNERRVFDLVVETVCRPGTSQYFLLTPKLLPDLRYTERMTILSVLNGHWLPTHTEFNIKEFIRRKRLTKIS